MLRDDTRSHFNAILEQEPIFQCLPKRLQSSIVSKIESSCHNANMDYAKANHIPTFWDDENFVEHYSMNIYRVSTNLDPMSSINQTIPNGFGRTLMDRVLITAIVQVLIGINRPARVIDRLGIELKQIGYMTSQDLNSYPSQRYLEEIEIRATQKIEVKTTKMFQCPLCNKRDATFYRLQTRSGDEGYTTFVTCRFCEHRWTLRS
jgi:DNA-directed RNA polymerase subunit M/transcription elongation factor TFIIS